MFIDFKTLHAVFPLVNYLIERIGLTNQAVHILKLGEVPKHIGFIMDGNRTYAKLNGLPTAEGHREGAKALVKALDTSFNLGIKEVSIYAFSIENFSRPKKEVDDIHEMLRDSLRQISEKKTIPHHDVRLRITGNRSLIAPDILADLVKIEDTTNTNGVTNIVNVCFAYTSRDEIAHSVREVVSMRDAQMVTKDEINEQLIEENLYINSLSEPLDILIRTSGQTRLSDFLLWQCNANCKIVYINTLWPSMNFLHLYWILLKWSFKCTIAQNGSSEWNFPKAERAVTLKQLPACPPFASVTEVTKARA